MRACRCVSVAYAPPCRLLVASKKPVRSREGEEALAGGWCWSCDDTFFPSVAAWAAGCMVWAHHKPCYAGPVLSWLQGHVHQGGDEREPQRPQRPRDPGGRTLVRGQARRAHARAAAQQRRRLPRTRRAGGPRRAQRAGGAPGLIWLLYAGQSPGAVMSGKWGHRYCAGPASVCFG